jgi:hypothetical protein
MERQILEPFLGRQVALTVNDNGRVLFRRGVVQCVMDDSLLLRFGDSLQGYALSTILTIRETENGSV